LIAQTCKKGLRKYKSTYHALSTILKEEYSTHHPQTSISMLLGIWLTPNLLIPSILQHGLEPLFEHITPLLADRLLNSRKARSIAVVLLDFTISTIELLIMTPIETVRKRLQCQAIITTPMEGSREYNTVVEIASTPLAYSSPLDCVWRILMVEDGISGLYRGFKAKLTYSFAIALLQLGASMSKLEGFE
jgi:fusion and transport protein UGO1